MATSAEQMRAHRGPALFSAGFRPFFLFGAVWAALSVLLWLPMWEGHFTLPSRFSPLDWHVHETLYGYLPAAAAGFLLTAIPNWTGRLPVVGRPLALLFTLWVAGRLAIPVSGIIGGWTAAIVDAGFLLALLGLTFREVWSGRNWRNLRVVATVALLALGNVAFHVEALTLGTAAWGTRIGLAGAVILVNLIGGRIVPSFTINWLRSRAPGRTPVPFGRGDQVVSGITLAALTLWVILPEGRATGAGLLVAGVAQAWRLSRWAGWRTWGEKLVLVLHLGYLGVPLGFLLLGASLTGLLPILPSAALHAWTVGAVGLMTLAVMTRASLGHTGRPLHATTPIALTYLACVIAMLARIVVGFGAAEMVLLHVALLGWIAAFLGFAIIYRPILTAPR